MTRVYMVRHGRAAAGWNVDPDPGLDDLGRRVGLLHELVAAGVEVELVELGYFPESLAQDLVRVLPFAWLVVCELLSS